MPRPDVQLFPEPSAGALNLISPVDPSANLSCYPLHVAAQSDAQPRPARAPSPTAMRSIALTVLLTLSPDAHPQSDSSASSSISPSSSYCACARSERSELCAWLDMFHPQPSPHSDAHVATVTPCMMTASRRSMRTRGGHAVDIVGRGVVEAQSVCGGDVHAEESRPPRRRWRGCRP